MASGSGRSPKRVRIGDLLVEAGLVQRADIDAAVAVQNAAGGRLGQILLRMGALSETDLLQALSGQLDVPLLAEPPPVDAVRSFIAETMTSRAWWRERRALAWRRLDDDGLSTVICAAADPLDGALGDILAMAGEGADPRMHLISAGAVLAALEGLQPETAVRGDDAARLRELAQETPVIDFVNSVFAEAQRRGASDIHVEPFEDAFRVRLRIDGVLQTVRQGTREDFDAVCSRVKLLSGMDIGERRLPQDGRQTIRIAGQESDLRVSTLPGSWGESLAVRLLGKSARLPTWDELGLGPEDAAQLARLAALPNGVILVTGPTGSGKTTTIYRLLTGLNDGLRKIVTVEDPVEFDLPGVVQVRVKPDIGLSFAAGLRSILRQDPDIIMVGEIRDVETARICIQAALTGHLVIATVHTNSALAAVSRLVDLGIEPYLLSDVLRGLVGQRLVRRLCDACSEAAEAPAGPSAAPGDLPPERWRRPTAGGCPKCEGSGYAGRLGLFEVIAIGPAFADLIRARTGEAGLVRAAGSAGVVSLLQDGIAKAKAGRTSFAEVQRVVSTEAGPRE